MSDEESRDTLRAMATIARSTRVRLWLVTAWGVIAPFVWPALAFASAWVLKSIQVESQFAEVRLWQERRDRTDQERWDRLTEFMLKQEQVNHAIGAQAAYATGAALGGETAKVWSTKRKDGDKYLSEYVRLTFKEKPTRDPQTAYKWLLEK